MRLDEDHKKYWYGNLISTSAREKNRKIFIILHATHYSKGFYILSK
jgi:hypothetical protein